MHFTVPIGLLGQVTLVLLQLCLGCASSHQPTGQYYSSLAWHSRTELVVGTPP